MIRSRQSRCPFGVSPPENWHDGGQWSCSTQRRSSKAGIAKSLFTRNREMKFAEKLWKEMRSASSGWRKNSHCAKPHIAALIALDAI